MWALAFGSNTGVGNSGMQNANLHNKQVVKVKIVRHLNIAIQQKDKAHSNAFDLKGWALKIGIVTHQPFNPPTQNSDT